MGPPIGAMRHWPLISQNSVVNPSVDDAAQDQLLARTQHLGAVVGVLDVVEQVDRAQIAHSSLGI